MNPCRIPGADSEEIPERPVLTLAQVFALAEQMPAAFRAMVVLTTFGCPRWGEVTALQRRDLDVVSGTVRVRHAFVEVSGGGVEFGPPKSRAGLRTISIPPVILPVLIEHLVAFVPDDPEALVFAGPRARRPALRRNNFRKLVKWPEAVTKIGVPGLHFHDLRHTGNTLAAGTGASIRDLMTRMGHDSARAALIYQHATARADRAIADALSDAVGELGTSPLGQQDASLTDEDEDGDEMTGVPARI